MTVTGNLTYKSASQSSDMRLKKDVQQLDGSLDKVLKLRGVSYYWKNAEELKAINGKFPVIVLLDNGQVVREYCYRNMKEEEIREFFL